MQYVCTIYKDRPATCVGYPWNFANQIFADCQFYKKDENRLLELSELKSSKSIKEINDFCVSCGHCCFFGPAACSKLKIIPDKINLVEDSEVEE